jgi:hypothetical protein
MTNAEMIEFCRDLIDSEKQRFACDEERMPSSRQIASLEAIIGQLEAADTMRQAFRPLVDAGGMPRAIGGNLHNESANDLTNVKAVVSLQYETESSSQTGDVRLPFGTVACGLATRMLEREFTSVGVSGQMIL